MIQRQGKYDVVRILNSSIQRVCRPQKYLMVELRLKEDVFEANFKCETEVLRGVN
jgi:hypothetical protein